MRALRGLTRWYGKRRGVMIGMQNHDDFLKTAEETIKLVEAVDSDWFGVKLDIGSLRHHDPYEEIEKLLPYAISWQLKENVWYGEQETPTDIARVFEIIRRGGYRGWLPIETLGPGDPEAKLAFHVEPKFDGASLELVDAGATKFVVMPMVEPDGWTAELEALTELVLPLQT